MLDSLQMLSVLQGYLKIALLSSSRQVPEVKEHSVANVEVCIQRSHSGSMVCWALCRNLEVYRR